MMSTAARKEIYTEVLAESPDCQKVLKHCKPGEVFSLELLPQRDPGKDAVKVMRRSGELVGFLEGSVSGKVAPEIAARSDAEAVALLVTDGELYSKQSLRKKRLFSKPPRHCYIKITL
jgi:hypothetical protein